MYILSPCMNELNVVMNEENLANLPWEKNELKNMDAFISFSLFSENRVSYPLV